MLNSFMIHNGEAMNCDLDLLRSKGFEITPNGNDLITIEIPVGWRLARQGPYLYEITSPSGGKMRYSRSLRCLLITKI